MVSNVQGLRKLRLAGMEWSFSLHAIFLSSLFSHPTPVSENSRRGPLLFLNFFSQAQAQNSSVGKQPERPYHGGGSFPLLRM